MLQTCRASTAARSSWRITCGVTVATGLNGVKDVTVAAGSAFVAAGAEAAAGAAVAASAEAELDMTPALHSLACGCCWSFQIKPTRLQSGLQTAWSSHRRSETGSPSRLQILDFALFLCNDALKVFDDLRCRLGNSLERG